MIDQQSEINALRELIVAKDARIKELEDAAKGAAKDITDLVREIKRMRKFYGVPVTIGPVLEVGNMPSMIGYQLGPSETNPFPDILFCDEPKSDWFSTLLQRRMASEQPPTLQQGWRPSDETIETKEGVEHGKDL